jgi:hypothetical protein
MGTSAWRWAMYGSAMTAVHKGIDPRVRPQTGERNLFLSGFVALLHSRLQFFVRWTP